MKTIVSRKTINTYIYLKNHVINNKSADKQVHIFFKMKGLEMVKCFQKYLKYFPNNTHGKNQ